MSDLVLLLWCNVPVGDGETTEEKHESLVPLYSREMSDVKGKQKVRTSISQFQFIHKFPKASDIG